MKTRFAATLAALCWFALVLQFYVSLRLSVVRGFSVWHGVWMYFAFFTVLTNLFVALTITLPALAGRSTFGRFLSRPHVVTMAAASIGLVCMAYNLLLRQLWNPHGAQLWADVLMHDVIPVLFVAYWWISMPRGALRWNRLAVMATYPVAYFVYALLRGAVSGFYPYPFINVIQLGYPRVIANALAILVGYLVFAAILIALKRATSDIRLAQA